MSEDDETRRRRALYRASHRGTKEMDILLGRFAAARLTTLGIDALEHFERFLELADPKLQSWIFDPTLVDRDEFRDLISDVRAFHGLAPSRNAS